jgi:hypothetical protein
MSDKLDEHDKKIHHLEIQLTEIKGTVDHIKDRIDNGMSTTITKIWDKINVDIMPAVQDSTFWVGKLKQAVFWIAVMAFVGGVAKIGMSVLGL